MDDWKLDRIAAAERGENPTVLVRLSSGFVVFGDVQFLPDYCVLLAAPRVDHLTDLPCNARLAFLNDMGIVGEAIMQVCRPVGVNYEIQGNSDHFLHAHVIPRYEWELPERRVWPATHYPPEVRSHPQFDSANSEYRQLRDDLTNAIRTLWSSSDSG